MGLFPDEMSSAQKMRFLQKYEKNQTGSYKKVLQIQDAARSSIGHKEGRDLVRLKLNMLMTHYDLIQHEINTVWEKVKEILLQIPAVKERGGSLFYVVNSILK